MEQHDETCPGTGKTLQDGAPKIAKLVYKWLNYGLCLGTLDIKLVGGLEHECYDFSTYWECHHPN